MIFTKTILIIVCLLIFYQDLKERQVYWFLFPLFGICSAILLYKNTLPDLFYVYLGMNLIVVSLMLISALLYIKLKLKMKFKDAFGFGDVLLFIGLIFSFATLSFLFIFVFALVFSLVCHHLTKRYSKSATVPLAGYMSLFFGLTYISYWAGLTNSLYTF